MGRCAVVFLLFAVLVQGQDRTGRYIVELADEPAADVVLRSSKDGRRAAGQDLRAAAAALREGQQRLAAQVEARGAVVLDAVQIVANALLVRASEDVARELAGMPGVKRVIEARPVELHMDRALLRHAAPAAWTRIGGADRAGFGIRIGILDTGLDASHPAFHDPALPVPEGFPRANTARDLRWTNNKVIVARVYDMFYAGPAPTEPDVRGHGTTVAACAAAARSTGPYGEPMGLAPKAYLGNYKVFPGTSASYTDDAVLKALDDAVADGMQVINMSLGRGLVLRAGDYAFKEVFRRVAALGVLIVCSAGNRGPGAHTIGSMAAQDDAVAVGAVRNDRMFAGSLAVEGLNPMFALPSAKHGQAPDVRGPLFDIERLDPTGLGCGAYAADALKGFIAFIKRGTCTYEVKINNAAQAGAIAALIYAHETSPDPSTMSIGSATLPAAMIGYADGLAVKDRLRAAQNANATIRFRPTAWPTEGRRITDFSSRGPNVDYGIKPDLLAVGENVYAAAPGNDFAIVRGTSFAAPIVSGAAAVLMAYRPGLAVWQYRSLLINTAETLVGPDGVRAPVQHQGAGVLNLDRALEATITAFPTAVAFGVGSGSVNLTRTVWLATVGDAPDDVTATAEPFTPESQVTLSAWSPWTTPLSLFYPHYIETPPNAVRVRPGALQPLQVRFVGTNLAPGEYQGFIRLHSSRTGQTIQLPYWYGVPSNTPSAITVLEQDSSGRAGAAMMGAFSFRVTDASGIRVSGVTPTVTVSSGGGAVLQVYSRDAVFPGVFSADVRLGPSPGANVFRIQVASLTADVTITGN